MVRTSSAQFVSQPIHFAYVVPPAPPEVQYFDEFLLSDLSPHQITRYSCRGIRDQLPHALSAFANDTRASGSPIVPLHHLVNVPTLRSELILLGAHPGVVFVHDSFLDEHGPEAIINSGFSDTVAMIRGDRNEFPARKKSYHREKYYAVRELSFAVLPIFTDARMHAAFLERTEPSLAVGSSYLPWPVHTSSLAPVAKQNDRLRIAVATPHVAFDRWEMHRVLDALAGSGIADRFELCWMVRDEAAAECVKSYTRAYQALSISVSTGLSPQRWQHVVAGCDLAIHLQGGKFCQLGPYLPISVGSGIPTVTTELHAMQYPQQVIYSVRSGGTLSAELARILHAFAAGQIAKSNQVAIEYIAATHAPAVVRDELLLILERYYEALMQRMADIAQLTDRSHAEILREISMPAVVRPLFEELGWLEARSTRPLGVLR